MRVNWWQAEGNCQGRACSEPYLQVPGSSIGARRLLSPVPGSELEEQVLPDQLLRYDSIRPLGL